MSEHRILEKSEVVYVYLCAILHGNGLMHKLNCHMFTVKVVDVAAALALKHWKHSIAWHKSSRDSAWTSD